jgi:hypothetical protein
MNREEQKLAERISRIEGIVAGNLVLNCGAVVMMLHHIGIF